MLLNMLARKQTLVYVLRQAQHRTLSQEQCCTFVYLQALKAETARANAAKAKAAEALRTAKQELKI